MLAVRLLGQFEVEVDGRPIAVSAPMQRGVLAMLALARGHGLSIDQLVDGLWADPPANAVNALQVYVSALRKRLGPELVVTVGKGYRLDLVAAEGELDVDRFAELVDHARQRRRTGDFAVAARALTEAIELWRGTALSGLPDYPFVNLARGSLERAYVDARCSRIAVETELGRAPVVVPEAWALANEYPLDEGVAGQLMRTLASSGRTAEALEVYGHMRAKLSEELGIEPGEHLRAAQAAVLTQDPELMPTPMTAWLADTVPRPPRRLLGRERELAEVESLLEEAVTSLVTLAGPGGVGKTRLAVEVARRAAGVRDVVFVALDVIDSADLVMPSLAAALKVKPSADLDLVTQMASAVHGRDLLIVLDNFEHVIDGARDLALLLGAAPEGLQILVTSRESLRLRGEQLYRLGPLATAGDGTTAPAVELFTERARAAGAQMDENDSSAVKMICARLDGLPLAIELAAARTNVLPVTKIMDRLDRRMSLLTAGARDSPDRQRSLRACLEWSVDLLSGDERDLFAAVSVFAGGATVEALETVCTRVHPHLDVLSSVDALIAKSLLRPLALPAGTRFVMLDTVREYAGEMLSASKDEARVKVAHARHYHDLLKPDPARGSRPPRNTEEMAIWTAELPNARAALETLLSTGDTQRRAELVAALGSVWQQRGGLTSEFEPHAFALMDSDNVSPHVRVELLWWAAYNAYDRGDRVVTRDLLDRGLALISEHPNPVQEAHLRFGSAVLAYSYGDMVAEAQEAARAMAAAIDSGDREVVAQMTAILPSVDGPALLANAELALSVAREFGNQWLEGEILTDWSERALGGDDATLAGLAAKAAQWARAGHDVFALLGDVRGQANGLLNSGGGLLLAGGSAVEAAADLRESLKLSRHAGQVALELEGLVRLAAAEAAQAHVEMAMFLYQAWRGLCEKYDHEASPSNQRIIDRFIDDLPSRPLDPVEPAAQLSLSEVVEVALWEQSLPEGLLPIRRDPGMADRVREVSHP